ncbi:threonine/serine dehydratase [Sphingomonas sp. BN140010]|uniref:Threonine/serine dehydratase n=1 Tax=Sphingomonas arvum TaxID=2992113 RepID=A0ABT3JED0_9SPHN|nr:threonine/serine dehydratase [Sphingomonas sp. BN140010]MCW3797445.1 threonine/serine dehydratase [Sphingomonas sp. BN140010]
MELDREGVVAAAQRIAGLVERTPLIEAHLPGGRVWLKAECLQTGGSFKLRGATNRLLQLSEVERRAGVVAFSSGNHAQGVAIAAKRLGIPAVIVMPSDAPALKVAGTRAQAAEVVFYDRATEDRVTIAQALADERGAVLVPSFDDPHIVAGQGTAGLELVEQCPEPVRRVLVCCGGGGLSAGIALAVPDAEIVCVEPAGWDDMGSSLELGRIVPVEPDAPPTLCDALQTPRVSPITFGILQGRGAQGVSVSDEEVKAAVRWAWQELQLVVEPGGSVALAALLAGKVPVEPGTVAALSGGNIDPALHAELIG